MNQPWKLLMVADAKGRAFAALRRRVPGAYLVRIENAAGVGLPDVYGVFYGRSFWVELKVGTRTPEGHLKVPRDKLRPEQLATCLRLTQNGAEVYVAVLIGSVLHAVKFEHLSWVRLGEGGPNIIVEYLPGETWVND